MSTSEERRPSVRTGQTMKTKFCLVRHGSTDWNIEGRIQGCTDTTLNQQGRREVSELAQSLKRQDWEFIITSELQRAKETGKIISNTLQIPLFSYNGLREREFGPLEGLTLHEIKERYPSWGDDLSLPELESREELKTRALKVMDLLAHLFPARKLIIVSHGGFLRAFFRAGLGLERTAPANAEKVEVVWDGSWKVLQGGERNDL